MSPQGSFVYGAFILFASSFVIRVIGFIYQIVVVRLIGAEGIGLYQMVFPIYLLVLVLTTAGIPLAVSKLVAEQLAFKNYHGVYRIFRTALGLLLFSGVLFTVILYLHTPFLVSRVFIDPRVYWCFLLMVPGIFFVSISSAFRGFFQGQQNMTPTAVGQIVEQITRVGVGLYFALEFLHWGIEFAAAGLSIGMVTGEIVGLFTMLFFYTFTRPRIPVSGQKYIYPLSMPTILKKIYSLALPISVNRIVLSLMMSAEAILIPYCLQIGGVSFREATIFYGQFSGMALTLLTIPTILTNSLSTSLVPAISEALARKNFQLVRVRSSEAVRITIIFGLPGLVCFYLLAEELCSLLFHNPEAGNALEIMAIGGIFLYLQQTLTGILQGLGKVKIPLWNNLIGAVIKLSAIALLTPIPNLGIKGVAIAFNLYFVVVAVLNFIAVVKNIGLSFDFYRQVLLPLLSAGFMACFVITIWSEIFVRTQSSTYSTQWAVIGGLIIYFITLFMTGGINSQDLKRIPIVGQILTKIL